MSTPLSHVLSVAITTLLIVALVASATGFLDTHKQRTASDELRTIGNRLAAELASADAVAQNGENVTVSTRHPDTIAGSTYSVVLRNGSSACGALSANTTFTCLQLEATQPEVSEIVPVHNETNLSLVPGANGRFVITSPGGDGTEQADPRRLELSPRVGIGQEVGSSPSLGTGSVLAQTPIPDFVVNPPVPQTNSDVEFDGTLSQDPDDTIDTWEWDFDGDGTYEETGAKPTWNYSNAGEKIVSLKVTDQTGLSGSLDRAIHVAGLEYNEDVQTAASGDGVTFTVTNRHLQPIHIERILIDPVDSDIDEVSEGRPDGFFDDDYDDVSPHEIEIDNSTTGSIDGYVDWNADDGYELSIPDGGIIVNFGDVGDGYAYDEIRTRDDAILSQDETARVTIQDFTAGPGPSGEKFTFGLRYEVGSTVNSNVFNATVP